MSSYSEKVPPQGFVVIIIIIIIIIIITTTIIIIIVRIDHYLDIHYLNYLFNLPGLLSLLPDLSVKSLYLASQ